ncbi:MAG TPA: ATP-binding protein, partial [Ohtaekwangia sp.]
EGDIQNWNAGAEHIKGYRADEVIGKNFRIFYTPESIESKLPEKLLEEARQTGKATHEGWRLRKDESRFWTSVVITALHDKNQQVIGFSKVTRDLTEKKMAEDKLREYTHELELQNKELEQFAYVASHDLQEPLRKIMTFSEMVQKQPHSDDTVKRYVDKISSSAQRMNDLIKSVLNYSRLLRNEDQMTSADLNLILKNTLSDFELLIEEKHARIEAEPLPVVTGIALQINQVFTNVISNALKFTTDNPQLHIATRMVSDDQVVNRPKILAEGSYHEITFTDNGIGFEEQYEKQIFGMFQRLHARHEFSGTGIGLALCKKIMENHGGYITAKSEHGKGSTFYVYFPIKDPA